MVWLPEEWARKKADKHVVSQPRILRKAKQYLIRQVGNHRPFVPYVHHKWDADMIYELGLVRAQDMGLKLYQTFSSAVVHVGGVPAECNAKVVGHDYTILYERPEVAPHTPAILAEFRASGDRWLDTHQ